MDLLTQPVGSCTRRRARTELLATSIARTAEGGKRPPGAFGAPVILMSGSSLEPSWQHCAVQLLSHRVGKRGISFKQGCSTCIGAGWGPAFQREFYSAEEQATVTLQTFSFKALERNKGKAYSSHVSFLLHLGQEISEGDRCTENSAFLTVSEMFRGVGAHLMQLASCIPGIALVREECSRQDGKQQMFRYGPDTELSHVDF